MATDVLLGAWVATGLTLCMYSFLYEDNPFFKFGEHLYVGVSMGYTIVRIYYDVMVKSFYVPTVGAGKWVLLVPAAIGLLLLARLVPPIAWLSRIAFAFIVGFGSGVAIPRIISSYILQQVQGTIVPLSFRAADWTGRGLLDPKHPLNTLLILVGVVAVLVYFFFSVEHRGPVRVAARVGIYFLMVSFGAAFGYTVMARMSLLIGRFDDLLRFAGPQFWYATPVLLVLIGLGLRAWARGRRAGPDASGPPA